ncbi:MAG: hypothetical protein ABW104_03970 [Candidatus Thiodiazotropha sp. 6PLUC2]
MRSKIVLFIVTLFVASLSFFAQANTSQSDSEKEELLPKFSSANAMPENSSLEKSQENNIDKISKNESISSEHDSSQGVPYRKDSIISGETLTRLLIAIVIALLLIIVIVYALKKFLFARDYLSVKENRMQLLDVKRLSPRLTLFMVRIDDKTVVLAQSGEQLLTIDPVGSSELLSENSSD